MKSFYNEMLLPSKWLLPGLLFSLAFSAAVSAQTDVGYLNSVQSKADTASVDQKTTQAAEPKRPNPTRLFKSELEDNLGGARIGLSAGLTLAQFERVLKNNYIGSYLFYKRLSDAKKAQVFEFYQTNADPSAVREKILQMSKQ